MPKARYGIAEWFGKDITTLTPEERQKYGQLAVAQDQKTLKKGVSSEELVDEGDTEIPPGAPVCPFLSTLIPGAPCNKASGVCSIRKYARSHDASDKTGVPVPGDKIVTVCPFRFLQPVDTDTSLFAWIAEKMLDIDKFTVVKETPFLRTVSDVARPAEIAEDMKEEAEEEGKKAGRIDWIVVNPATMETDELAWCAVETQALYFSGNRMRLEFDAYAAAPSPVLFPAGKRRPDYRSSGPKRLAPQLDVKVPVLRNWGKKVVVVIDRFFYNNMNRLDDAYPRAKNDRERRDNAEVVWFVVDYDENMQLIRGPVLYSTLESSHRALNATEPLSKEEFTENLRQIINKGGRANKVFRASE